MRPMRLMNLQAGCLMIENPETGEQLPLGDVREITITEEPARDMPEGIKVLPVSREATITIEAPRINRKLLHELMRWFPYRPKRRWRNERKAGRMYWRAIFKHHRLSHTLTCKKEK